MKKTPKFGAMERSMEILREDAKERGMQELAVAYGISQIRLRDEFMSAIIERIITNARA